jgi:hypothetical protein
VNLEKIKEEGLFNTTLNQRRAPANTTAAPNQNRRKNYTNKRRR